MRNSPLNRSKNRSRFPRVKGNCPMGCGDTLFLGEGGYVTCSWIDCPNPSRASQVLSQFEKGVRSMVFVTDESKMTRAPNSNAAVGFAINTAGSPDRLPSSFRQILNAFKGK